ncbi:hypothetical protein U9M48_001266 [Paspalum notatum var. saurae]|uniref:Uncharacterized protein n=1 Tax=Paspalum notatum var. saurae TaxID=547442 RepID=A0AAQ3PP12_PASNO
MVASSMSKIAMKKNSTSRNRGKKEEPYEQLKTLWMNTSDALIHQGAETEKVIYNEHLIGFYVQILAANIHPFFHYCVELKRRQAKLMGTFVELIFYFLDVRRWPSLMLGAPNGGDLHLWWAAFSSRQRAEQACPLEPIRHTIIHNMQLALPHHGLHDSHCGKIVGHIVAAASCRVKDACHEELHHRGALFHDRCVASPVADACCLIFFSCSLALTRLFAAISCAQEINKARMSTASALAALLQLLLLFFSTSLSMERRSFSMSLMHIS